MPSSTFSTTTLLFISVLAVLSTLLNGVVWFDAANVSQRILNSQEHDYNYGMVTPVQVPGSYSPTTMVVQKGHEEYPLRDDKKWGDIVPPQRGFIRLGKVGTPFAIAMYHQLHCVNGIRFAYVAQRDGLFKKEKDREDAFHHVNHCFDVIRQSLLCKADTTLISPGSDKHTRRCRDWAQVRAFVDSNHQFWADTPFQLPTNRSDKGSYQA